MRSFAAALLLLSLLGGCANGDGETPGTAQAHINGTYTSYGAFINRR